MSSVNVHVRERAQMCQTLFSSLFLRAILFLSQISNKQESIQSDHNAQQLNLIKDEIDFCV